MKTIATFGLVVTASLALLQPAQGGSRGSGHARSFAPAPHFSGSGRHYSGGPRSFSGGGPRYYHSSQRFSAPGAFSNRTYSASSRRFSSPDAFHNRTSSRRLAVNRNSAFRSQGFNDRGRALARASRNWDRGRDHFWNGRRCHWRHNTWVFIDPWIYPWGFGYYPYGAYSYYDDGYASDEYSEAPAQTEYDRDNGDSKVSQVQAALAREGYYRGAIDGSFGPATRNALRQYQRNRGLGVTGQIDRPVLQALGLG